VRRMRRRLGGGVVEFRLRSRYTSGRRKLLGRKVPRAGVQVARVPPAPKNQGSDSGGDAGIPAEEQRGMGAREGSRREAAHGDY
jgi:hypothetical protein